MINNVEIDEHGNPVTKYILGDYVQQAKGIFNGFTSQIDEHTGKTSFQMVFITRGLLAVNRDQATVAVESWNWYYDHMREHSIKTLSYITSEKPISTRHFMSIPISDYTTLLSALKFYAEQNNDHGVMALEALNVLRDKL